jgi:hypothetical protein
LSTSPCATNSFVARMAHERLVAGLSLSAEKHLSPIFW